jgi:uncharacterized repeat protein (TIGR01451 family)
VAKVPGVDPSNDPTTGTDDHTDTVSVDVLHPQIEVDKIADTNLAHVGDTVTFTFNVTNPGDVALTVTKVDDPLCDSGTFAGPVKETGNGDALLDPGELWKYSCTHVLLSTDADPFVNHVDVVGVDPTGDPTEGEDEDADETVTDISHPQIAVEKTADTETAHVGDKVTYTFTVTNPGDIKLEVTKVDDAKCDTGTLTGPVKVTGNGDDWLDPGEKWTYSCTRVVKSTDADPFINVVVVQGTDPTDETNEGQDDSTDQVTVDLVHPNIEVDKKQRLLPSGDFTDGLVEAKVGDTIEYQVSVSNIGDVALTFGFSDPGCDAGTVQGPAKLAGNQDDKLDAGEVWIYRCTHVITAGDPDPYVNPVSTTGTAPDGTTVQDVDAVSSPRAPQQAVLGDTATGCEGKIFRVHIPGRGVKRVVFKVDGKTITTVRKKDSQGRFPFRVDPKLFAEGVTHKISAKLIQTNGKSRFVPMRTFTSCGIGKCVSRREFRIRVKKPKNGVKVVKAVVYVRNKRVKIIRGKRLRAPVVLKGLPIGRFKVRVVSTLSNGKTATDIRTYHTCIPRSRRPGA